MSEERPRGTPKRKKPYVAGIAALNFKPDFDWDRAEARALFDQVKKPVAADTIQFQDCVKGMQGMPPESVDLVIADPPFGIEFDGRGSQYNRKQEFVATGYQEVGANYDVFTDAWVKMLPRIMKATASAFIFSGWTNLKDVLVAVDRARLAVINHIIWKYQFGVFTRKKFVTSHYHVLFLAKDPKRYFFNKIEHYPLDIWDISRTYSPGEVKNGTKLPEDVVARCIDFCSRPGDLVFDPFMGNGTTAVCAKARFRHYTGFESNTSMQSILKNNIEAVVPGQNYVPYREKLPDPDQLAKKYPAVRKEIQKRDC